MPRELLKVSMLAGIITSYYQKVAELIYNDDEDNDEYNEIIKKIQETIKLEKEEYNKINLETIDNYFENYDYDGDSPLEGRLSARLIELKNLLLENPKTDDGKLLSSVIDGKIMVDTLKIVENRIEKIKDENINDENFENLIKYYQISKLSYLTNTSYLEDQALKYNFDITRIPSLQIEEINELFNIDLINDYSNILHLNIFTGLNALDEINTEDEILNTYLALTELSRIEALLSYLDKKTIYKVFNTYKETYNNSKNEPIITAKKLIKRRINELK